MVLTDLKIPSPHSLRPRQGWVQMPSRRGKTKTSSAATLLYSVLALHSKHIQWYSEVYYHWLMGQRCRVMIRIRFFVHDGTMWPVDLSPAQHHHPGQLIHLHLARLISALLQRQTPTGGTLNCNEKNPRESADLYHKTRANMVIRTPKLINTIVMKRKKLQKFKLTTGNQIF